MAAGRLLLVGVAALLGLLLGGVWLVPPLLDWNRYRDDVAALASVALGRSVRIDGPITLQLLPQPLLTAGRVAVAQGGGGATVTATQLELRVALGPLLAGRVDAQELVLRGADIRLPWPLDPDALAVRTPDWLAAVSARIEGGRLRLGDVEFTGINATLATADDTGSFFSAGRAQTGGRTWVFTARVTRPGGDGAVGLDVTLDGQGAVQGVGATLSGQIQPDGSMLGRVAGRGPDLSQLLPAPPVPFRAEGRLSIGGGLVAADELVGEIGGAPTQGAVALRLSPALRLDVALTASRLDLDAWLPALLRAASGGGLGRMPVGLDLSAEAAQLAGGTIRGLRGAFDVGAESVSVRELRGVLPGEAALQARGRILPADGARAPMRFEGSVALAAPALRITLDWAGAAGLGPFAALPAGVLRSATLAGRLEVEPERIGLSDVTGTLDDAVVAASLDLRFGARPGLRAVLALERLDLDAWLPELPTPQAALAAPLGAYPLQLQLEVRQARLRDLVLTPLVLDVASEAGRLSLRRLEAQATSGSLAASGTLHAGGRISDGRLELRAAQAAGLAGLIPEPLAGLLARMPDLLRDPLALQAQFSGTAEALGLRAAADLGDLRLEVQPTVDLLAGRWAGSLTLRHPGAPRLMEAMGLVGTQAWLGEGSLALVAQLVVTGERASAESFDLVAGGLRVGGTLALDRGAVPRLSGRIAAETLPLPLPGPRALEPLPLDALAGWLATVRLEAGQVLLGQWRLLEQATATLSLADGVLRLDGLAGRMGGGTLAGTLRVETAARPPAVMADLTLRGAIAAPAIAFPLELAGGTLDLSLGLSAHGYAPAALLASLGGRVRLTARDGVLAGLTLDRMGTGLAEADVRAALAGGSTAFDGLEVAARLDRGLVVLEQAALAGPAGTVTATGSIDLIQSTLALRLAVLPAVPEAPEIGLRLAGPLDAPQRVAELAAVTRWRAEHGR